MEYILEEPKFDATQCETLRSANPIVNSYSPDPNLTPPSMSPQPSQPSGSTSSSRGLKRKARMVDIIDQQLERLNTRFVEMNIHDGNLLDNCYDLLCGHPNVVKQLFDQSLERQMRKLMKIVTKKSLNYVKFSCTLLCICIFLFESVIIFITQTPKQIKDFHDSFE